VVRPRSRRTSAALWGPARSRTTRTTTTRTTRTNSCFYSLCLLAAFGAGAFPSLSLSLSVSRPARSCVPVAPLSLRTGWRDLSRRSGRARGELAPQLREHSRFAIFQFRGLIWGPNATNSHITTTEMSSKGEGAPNCAKRTQRLSNGDHLQFVEGARICLAVRWLTLPPNGYIGFPPGPIDIHS